MGQPSVDAFDEVEVDADEVEVDAEAVEEAAPTRARQSLKLHGHTQNVNCLAALADGRLASGSSDHSIIIWNLADGKQLATLDGHEGGVRCLAALEGGRLASGSSDKTIIIWSIATKTQLAKLEGHTEPLRCLAALDGARLASGGLDKSIIIWSLADGSQLATLEGHTDFVSSLVALDGGRLVSGSADKSIIIWNLAAGTQLAKLEGHTSMIFCVAALEGGRLASGSENGRIRLWNADGKLLTKLEGHTAGVLCLAELAGDRLASGGSFGRIIIWNLADFSQLASLEGHRDFVRCLAALDGGLLASGSGDMTIRVRPLLDEATRRIMECSSAFEFECLAEEYCEADELGDLLAAALQQFEECPVGRVSSSATITRQAHVFDAIAKVITADDDNTALVEGLLDLVHDDDLLPEMKRRDCSDAAVELLAPTALFRVVLDAKYALGSRLLLFVEFVSFLVIMFCFARIATIEVLRWDTPWILGTKGADKTLALCVAFVLLAYFSAREAGQIRAARFFELTELEDFVSKKWNSKRWVAPEARGLRWYALALPRYVVLSMVLVILSPLRLVAWCTTSSEGSSHASPGHLPGLAALADASHVPHLELFRSWFDLTVGTLKGHYEDNQHWWVQLAKAQDSWFGRNVSRPILHDPTTFLGLPRAWRWDYWNWLDVAVLACSWTAFVRAATPGVHLSAHLAATNAVLLWLALFGFLKHLDQRLATFVLMFERIVRDLWIFLFFYLLWVLMFGSAFCILLGSTHAREFEFHDTAQPNAFESARMTIYSLLVLSFIGDFDPDNFPEPVDKFYLILYLLVTVVVQLNILIAIVSDSYDAAMARSEALYYRAHNDLITETWGIASWFPRCVRPTIDDAWIRERLAAALEECRDGDNLGRIVDTTQRTRAAVKEDVQRAVAPLNAKIERLEALLQQALLRDTSRLRR